MTPNDKRKQELAEPIQIGDRVQELEIELMHAEERAEAAEAEVERLKERHQQGTIELMNLRIEERSASIADLTAAQELLLMAREALKSIDTVTVTSQLNHKEDLKPWQRQIVDDMVTKLTDYLEEK